MSTVLMEERTCLLGGQQKSRTLFNRSWQQVAALVGNIAVWLIAFLAVRSIWLLVIGLASTGLLWVALNRRTSVGESWLRARMDRFWFQLQSRRGRLDWNPAAAGGTPAVAGLFRELVWRQRTGPGGVVSLVHHATERDEFAHGSHFTAVLEVVGGGDGMREVTETNLRGQRFGALLAGLTSTEIPVDQLDLETRVLPTPADAYEARVLEALDPECPPLLRQSMEQLAALGAAATEHYRSFATVRMPFEGIVAKAGGPGAGQEEVTVAALETVRRVVERLKRSGHTVHGVLGPRRIAAMIRHLYVPDHAIDDSTGLLGLADGWCYPYRVEKTAVVVDAGDLGEWWHAVASVPMDAWPLATVSTRWLESLVTDFPTTLVRTIKVQHRLLPRRVARERAKVGLTFDTANIASREIKGGVSTGEDEAQASAAQRVMDDLLHEQAGGDLPALRVLVSARSRVELEDARSMMTEQAEEAGIVRLKWHDYRHDQAIVLMAPFARGVVE